MNVLRVGFLGAGLIAQTHISRLLQIPGIEITAVCDNLGEKAAAAVEKNKLQAKAFDDFELMMENNTMDCLYVCLPPYAHEGQVEKAAGRGIHVFAEKPLGLSSSIAQGMVEAVKKAGVHSHVGYHMRSGAAVQKLKKLIDDGIAGLPVLFDARYECNSLHTPWWRDMEKSGGQVLEQVIHLYDMALYLMGIPDAVSGFRGNICHRDMEDYTVEDVSNASIRFMSGALGNISATNCAVPGQWKETMTVVFQNITVYFSNSNNAEFVYTSGGEVKRETLSGSNDMKLEESKMFFEAIRNNSKDSCNLEEGYKSLVLVETVVKSSNDAGRVMRINF